MRLEAPTSPRPLLARWQLRQCSPRAGILQTTPFLRMLTQMRLGCDEREVTLMERLWRPPDVVVWHRVQRHVAVGVVPATTSCGVLGVFGT